MTLVVGDTTLFNSTWGGVESLTRLWTNLLSSSGVGPAVPTKRSHLLKTPVDS